jgi:hypothetical protein
MMELLMGTADGILDQGRNIKDNARYLAGIFGTQRFYDFYTDAPRDRNQTTALRFMTDIVAKRRDPIEIAYWQNMTFQFNNWNAGNRGDFKASDESQILSDALKELRYVKVGDESSENMAASVKLMREYVDSKVRGVGEQAMNEKVIDALVGIMQDLEKKHPLGKVARRDGIPISGKEYSLFALLKMDNPTLSDTDILEGKATIGQLTTEFFNTEQMAQDAFDGYIKKLEEGKIDDALRLTVFDLHNMYAKSSSEMLQLNMAIEYWRKYYKQSEVAVLKAGATYFSPESAEFEELEAGLAKVLNPELEKPRRRSNIKMPAMPKLDMGKIRMPKTNL